jgi:hypothetical protein
LIRKNLLCFSFLFLISPAVSICQPDTDTTLFIQSQENFTSKTYFFIGFGSSAHFSPAETENHGKIFGYYLTAGVVKGISTNFNLSSGIDAYSLPHYKNRLIGQLNLNAAYVFPINKNINLTLGTGLFTGFISWQERKQSGGFVSGLLINSSFLYRITPGHSMGLSLKYPFITDENRMLLSGLFFTF